MHLSEGDTYFSEIAGSAPHFSNCICLPRRTSDFGEFADNQGLSHGNHVHSTGVALPPRRPPAARPARRAPHRTWDSRPTHH